MARCTAEDWKYQLPWVLLRLRTAPRADSVPSTAEKTYDKPLVVPGKLVTEDRHNPSVQRVRDIVGHLHAAGLSSITHVFVRDDAVHLPPTRPYRGPFHVLERNNKAFLLTLHGKNDWVLVDCIKPALLEEDTDVTTPHPPPGQLSPQPAPLKKQARGCPRKHPPAPAHTRSQPPAPAHTRSQPPPHRGCFPDVLT
ncbi:uncharacterized protein [Macrobrachium rosenbergii]|uniref:uncharacterized protein n=1 Tax=Macrobrachium rosenbergii TaxID=79674 RepID=UPI0034D45416